MKKQTIAVTFVISCICNIILDGATNEKAIAQTVSQIQLLRNCGIPTVLPSYIPPGFKLTSFIVDACRNRFDNYNATYTGSNNCNFTVNGANGGWGAPGPVRQWKFNTQLFGKVILEEWDGSASGNPNYLSAAVLPNSRSGKVVIPGFPEAGYVFNFSCKFSVFSPQQAAEIIKSVRIVK